MDRPSPSVLRGALRDGRIVTETQTQIRNLEAAIAAAPAESAIGAGLTRQLAEAQLRAGLFTEAVPTAQRALERASQRASSPRRLMEAWTTLGHAQSLAAIVAASGIAPCEEALRRVSTEALAASLSCSKLKRLIAREFSAAGDLDVAEQLLAGQLAILKSGTRRAQREVLRVEGELAIVAFRRSQFKDAIQALEEIGVRQARLLGERHSDRLTTLHNLATAMQRTTRRREALALFSNVASMRVDVLGADHPDTLTTRSSASVLHAESDPRGEMTVITGILEDAQKSLSKHHHFLYEIAGRCAKVIEQSGAGSKLCEFLAEWLAKARDCLGVGHRETQTMMHEYGGALRNAGRLVEAYAIFGELAEVTRERHGDSHIDTLATVNNLAVVASDLGDAERAEGLYRSMLQEFGRLGASYDLQRASVRTNLGHLLLAKGEREEALAMFDAVLETRERLMPPGARLIELSRSNVAAALAALSRFDEAIRLHRQALEARTRHFGPEDVDRVASLHNLGTTMHQAGHPEEALPLLEQCLELRGKVLGPSHFYTIASMRAFADALSACGRVEPAESLLLKVINIIEAQRRDAGISDDLRRKFFAAYVPAYRELAFVVAGRGDFDRVFDISERVKARTLTERIASDIRLQRLNLSDEQRAEIRALERALAEAEGRIAEATDAYQRSAVILERDRIDQRLRDRESPGAGHGEPRSFELLSAAALGRQLAPDEGLLSYLVQSDRAVLVWHTGQGERGLLDLGRLDGLRRRVALITEGLSRLHEPTARAVITQSEIDELSGFLLGPLPAAIRFCRSLVIAPDDCLSAIPFEVLKVDGRPMVERYEIRYVPSMSFARQLSGRESGSVVKDIPMLAIGDPALPAITERKATSQLQSELSAVLERGAGSWSALPGSAQELANVKDIFDLEEGATLFVGPDASLERARRLNEDGILKRTRTLVFSTHGYLDPVEPNRSGIVLVTASGDPGILSAAEIGGWDLGCDLVFLSACDTGRGRFQPGEGVLGLPLAFMMAGARANIQTLWPIHDAASALFVSRFFQLYRQDRDSSAALTAVKREFLEGQHGSAYREPLYWAPFLLYGIRSRLYQES